MARIFVYMRVSTYYQDFDGQFVPIQKYAEENHLPIDRSLTYEEVYWVEEGVGATY
jgi:hypothetical protein